jgi:hypothetical protein
MIKKKTPELTFTNNSYSFLINNDGYASRDGYEKHDNQLNVKLTDEDMLAIDEINKEVFDNEISDSTLGRILIRRGIKTFKNLK